jgi:hypothetical protein
LINEFGRTRPGRKTLKSNFLRRVEGERAKKRVREGMRKRVSKRAGERERERDLAKKERGNE